MRRPRRARSRTRLHLLLLTLLLSLPLLLLLSARLRRRYTSSLTFLDQLLKRHRWHWVRLQIGQMHEVLRQRVHVTDNKSPPTSSWISDLKRFSRDVNIDSVLALTLATLRTSCTRRPRCSIRTATALPLLTELRLRTHLTRGVRLHGVVADERVELTFGVHVVMSLHSYGYAIVQLHTSIDVYLKF